MKPDKRLSYSSYQKLATCEQKFYYYKHDAEVDPTIEEDSTAFIIGRSFHYCLEKSMHRKPEKIMTLLDYCKGQMGLQEEHESLIHGMVLSYLRLRKKSPMKCLAVELELKNDKFIGYVDAIMEDVDGMFWILDLKTAGRKSESLAARLNRDPQLNLYASFYKLIAKAIGVNPKDFGGCIYNVTIKPRIKRRVDENYSDFVMRVANHATCIEYKIPKEDLDWERTMENHLNYQRRAEDILEGKIKPSRNFTECEKYFKPCSYWHLCYGKPYQEKLDELEVTTSD